MLSPLLAGLTSSVQFLTKISSHLSPHSTKWAQKPARRKDESLTCKEPFPSWPWSLGLTFSRTCCTEPPQKPWLDGFTEPVFLQGPPCAWQLKPSDLEQRNTSGLKDIAIAWIMASFASGRACGRCTIPALRRGAFALETRSISELWSILEGLMQASTSNLWSKRCHHVPF